jgi:hypothetical protein
MFAWKYYPDSQHFSYLEKKIPVLFCGMMFFMIEFPIETTHGLALWSPRRLGFL